MASLGSVPGYATLLVKHPPRVIRTEAENAHFTGLLEALDARGEALTSAEKEMAELLTLLIEDFEERSYELPKASPLEVVRFVMEQHDLRQKDMLDIFGSPSIASEVLSGKRELSKEHIRRLCDRFHLPADLLL